MKSLKTISIALIATGMLSGFVEMIFRIQHWAHNFNGMTVGAILFLTGFILLIPGLVTKKSDR